MRNLLLAGALFLLAWLGPLLLDRFMSEAPDIVWRILTFFLVSSGVTVLVFSDWSYKRLRVASDFSILYTAIIVASVAVIAGSAWWLLVVHHENPTLEVSARASTADRPSGSYVAGIRWRPSYAETLVIVSGSGEQAYSDIDIVVRTDTYVAAIGQYSGIPDVGFSYPSDDEIRMERYNPSTGERDVLPFDFFATDEGFRVRCPHLNARLDQRLRLVIAAVTIADEENDQPIDDVNDRAYRARIGKNAYSYWFGWSPPSERVYGPKQVPTTVVVEGSYVVDNVQKAISMTVEVIDPGDRAIDAAVERGVVGPAPNGR